MNSGWPLLVSVVVPAWNEEQLLGACLESLARQDYEGDFEIIVVDNASTDRTADIARQLGVRVVRCGTPGVLHARRAGARAARGEVIAQADADTVYPPTWLARIVHELSSHPEASAVAGRFVYADPPFWSQLEYWVRAAGNRLSARLAGELLFVSGANLAFRRAAFLAIGGYQPHPISSDQWGLTHRLRTWGPIRYDHGLVVSTSSRRVRKPALVVLAEAIRNCAQALAHFAKHLVTRFRPAVARLLVHVSTVRRAVVAVSFGVGSAPLLRMPARSRGTADAAGRRARRQGRLAWRPFAAAVPLAVVIAVASYGYAAPGAQVFGKVYSQEKNERRLIALTFDDGPNEPYTSEILDILARYHVPATFFLIGRNVELYPDTARRILRDGHVIGNHTYAHSANHALYAGGRSGIDAAEETIFRYTGVRPHLYRPPHGKKTPWELDYVRDHGLVEVTWSVAANDQHVRSAEKFAQAIVARRRDGGVILLHDGYGTLHGTAKSDRSLTVEALPLIIEGLQRHGYRFVTVPELFHIPAYDSSGG